MSSSNRSTISLYQLTAFGVCATLGAGIFVVCGAAGLEAGPSILLAFLISLFGAVLNALLFAELGTAVPSSGSTFAYAYVSLGEIPAVISAVLLMFEYGLSGAAVAQGCASYLIRSVPALDFLDYTHVGSLKVFPMAMLIMLLAIGITMLGTANSTKIQLAFVFLNFATIIAFVCFGAQYVDVDNLSPFFPESFGGTIRAAAILFFSYIGFDAVTVMSGQAQKKPHVLKAMLMVLFGVTVLYLAVAFVLLSMQPYTMLDINTPLITAYALAANDENGTIAKLVGISAFIVTAMTTISTYGGTPRVVKAMAECRLAPKSFCFAPAPDVPGHLNNEQLLSTDDKLTWTSIWTTGVVSIVLAGITPFDSLVDAITVATLFSYSMVAVCVIFEARKSWASGMLPSDAQRSLPATVGRASDAEASPVVLNTPVTPVEEDEEEHTVPIPVPSDDEKASEGAPSTEATASLPTGRPSEMPLALPQGRSVMAEFEGVKEGLEKDILVATLVAFAAPCFFYAFGDLFNDSFWGGFTSLFIFAIAAAYLCWRLWKSPSFLPADRYVAPCFPVLPCVVLLVNGVMCASMSFQGFWITFVALAVGIAGWAVAKYMDFRAGTSFVGINKKVLEPHLLRLGRF